MSVNVIAIRNRDSDDYLLESKCYGIWAYANEEEFEAFPKDYKLHFVTYQVFPNEKLEAHLDALEAAADKSAPFYYEYEARNDYIDVVEDSYPQDPIDFISIDDADNAESLICMEEIDWEAYRAEQSTLTEEWQQQSTDSVVADAIESVREHCQCNGGYPDYIRLSLIASGLNGKNPEFSMSDYRYIKGAVPMEVERPASGGLLLKTYDSYLTSDGNWSYYPQRYFDCTEGQARLKFWSYLQEQGVAAVTDE